MTEIPKAFEPQSVEDKWYAWWQAHEGFTADPARVSERRPACAIVIPPPVHRKNWPQDQAPTKGLRVTSCGK